MKLLALDPAAKTGFAWSDGTRREFGTWQLTSARDEHPGARLERFRSHIYRVHREWGVQRIAFENAVQGSHVFTTQGLHAELRGIILLTAKELGVEVLPVNPASLKKWACGKGNAKKPQMMAALKLQHGIDVAGDDNQADALWVLFYASQERLPEPTKVKRRRLVKAAKKEPRLF